MSPWGRKTYLREKFLEPLFKGNLQPGTVEIISEVSSFYNDKGVLYVNPMMMFSHSRGLMNQKVFEKGAPHTFFVKNASISSKLQNSNNKSFTLLGFAEYKLDYKKNDLTNNNVKRDTRLEYLKRKSLYNPPDTV